ncbi:MAG: ATP-binding protein, partial [Bacteroidales bacterium]
MLETIVQHLMDNATKFTEQGFIELSVTMVNNRIEFIVKDSGKGIPEDRLNAIFDRFVQVDLSTTRLHEGTGIGLAIAKGYADILNAHIAVESTIGQGSSFKLQLPANIIIAPEENFQHIEEKNDKKENNKLALIVEDDEISFMYLNIILKDAGFETIRAKDGIVAVQKCQKHKNISVILMDINLSGTDGLTAT